MLVSLETVAPVASVAHAAAVVRENKNGLLPRAQMNLFACTDSDFQGKCNNFATNFNVCSKLFLNRKSNYDQYIEIPNLVTHSLRLFLQEDQM
jgi:hypothetical protein